MTFVMKMTVVHKWEKSQQLNDINVKKVFYVLAKVNARLRDFQYKLLHRISPTKSFLYKFGRKDDILSELCNKEEESIEHLFLECEKVIEISGHQYG